VHLCSIGSIGSIGGSIGSIPCWRASKPIEKGIEQGIEHLSNICWQYYQPFGKVWNISNPLVRYPRTLKDRVRYPRGYRKALNMGDKLSNKLSNMELSNLSNLSNLSSHDVGYPRTKS